MTEEGRLWHLDWIRAGAMLLGIPFHVGLIYTPGQNWFVASQETSEIVAVVTGLLGSARMPLFFWVAGLLTAVVLARRDPGQWLRRRMVRLGVPLLFATLVISPVVMAAIGYRIARDGGWQAAGGLDEAFFALLTRPGAHWIGHLWFLQTLLVYSVLAVLLHPLIVRLGRRSWQEIHLGHVLLAAVLIGVWRLGVNGGWHLVTQHLHMGPVIGMLKIEPTLDYFPFFLLGLMMRTVELPPVHRSLMAWLVLIAAAAAYLSVWREPDVAHKAVTYLSGGILSVLGGCTVVSLFTTVVRRCAPRIDALVDSSYTVYLVHYPLVIWFGTLLQTVPLDPLLEWSLCAFGALVGSLLLHRAISGSPLLRFLLNGSHVVGGGNRKKHAAG